LPSDEAARSKIAPSGEPKVGLRARSDLKRPVVCFDESGEVRLPIPADPCRARPDRATSDNIGLQIGHYFRNNAVTICDRNRFAGCESDEFF
jgi:hypothetical protein